MKQKRTTSERVSRRRAQPAETAPAFEANAFYERLLEMREEKPAAYNTLSAATRLAVEAYVKARQSVARPESGRVAA